MAYTISEALMGMPPIGSISATQVVPGGKIVRAYDPVYGDAEFVFLQGVASTVQGSAVNALGIASNVPTWQTALLPNAGNTGCPVAFATAAVLATQWGWYQIGGITVALTTGVFAAAGPAFVGGVGQLISTAAAGKQILNAQGLTAVGVPAANQILLQIDRPFVQGQIT